MEKKVLLRIALLLTITIGLMGLARFYFGDLMTYSNIQTLIQDAGVWGAFTFIAIAVVSSLLHIPAYVLLAMCFLIYDGLFALLVGAMAVIAIFTVHFFFARLIGGNVEEHLKNPYIIKKLNSLEEKPLQSIILIRLFFFMMPVVNLALGLSSVRYHYFLIGSLLGISIHFVILFLLVNFSREMVMGWLG